MSPKNIRYKMYPMLKMVMGCLSQPEKYLFLVAKGLSQPEKNPFRAFRAFRGSIKPIKKIIVNHSPTFN